MILHNKMYRWSADPTAIPSSVGVQAPEGFLEDPLRRGGLGPGVILRPSQFPLNVTPSGHPAVVDTWDAARLLELLLGRRAKRWISVILLTGLVVLGWAAPGVRDDLLRRATDSYVEHARKPFDQMIQKISKIEPTSTSIPRPGG